MQNLTTTQATINKLLKAGLRIRGIFNNIRANERWCFIGDYPLFAFICHYLASNGINPKTEEIIKALKQTSEFKNIKRNSEIIRHFCA